jgi:hypothetical protein
MKRFKRRKLFDETWYSQSETGEIGDTHGALRSDKMDAFSKRLEDSGNVFLATKGEYRQLCLDIIEAGRPGNEQISETIESIANDVISYFDNAQLSIGQSDAASAARFAFTAGEKFELLRLKVKFEADAVRGISTAKAASDGGKSRREQLAPNTDKVLTEMRRLIADGRPVGDAAEAVARKDIGTSGSANRALWYRHLSPKL